MENIGSRVLRFFAVRNPMRDVGIDSLEVVLIQLGKARRILSCGLDLQPLIFLLFQRLQTGLQRFDLNRFVLTYTIPQTSGKVTVRVVDLRPLSGVA